MYAISADHVTLSAIRGILSMRQAGKSWRAIGTAMGVDHTVVFRFARRHGVADVKKVEGLSDVEIAQINEIDAWTEEFIATKPVNWADLDDDERDAMQIFIDLARDHGLYRPGMPYFDAHAAYKLSGHNLVETTADGILVLTDAGADFVRVRVKIEQLQREEAKADRRIA